MRNIVPLSGTTNAVPPGKRDSSQEIRDPNDSRREMPRLRREFAVDR
jgi:hypothetical protein